MAQFKKDYTYVTDKDENQVCVAVVGGKYDGVIYKYGKVSVPNENNLNPDGSLPFQFEYDILDPVKLKQEDFGEDFFNLIGDILVDIIDEKIEDQQLGYND